MKAQHKLSINQNYQASKHYHAHYDNILFTRATRGKTSVYANALIDEALALCGSPYFKLSHRHWGQAAIEFLSKFVV